VGSLLKLIIEDDEGKTTIYPLADDDVSIGRREGNTIRLMERNVSRRHARLSRTDERVVVEDLDSYNGVHVNGERIRGRRPVHVGDLVEIGDYHLTLQRVEAEPELPGPEPAVTPGLLEEHATRPLAASPPNAEDMARDTLIDQPAAERTPALASTVPLGPAPTDGVPAPFSPDRLARLSEVPRVICVSTEYAGRAFPLGTETVIGRVDDNDVVIEHRSVSRSHAKIVTTGSGHRIVDLQSANGILVNGEEYAMTDLREGDLVELGHVHFRYVPAGVPFEPSDEEARAIREQGVVLDEPPAYDPSTAATVTDTPMLEAGFAANGAMSGAATAPQLQPSVRPTPPQPLVQPMPDPTPPAVQTVRPAPAALPPEEADDAWTRPHPVAGGGRRAGLWVLWALVLAAAGLGGWWWWTEVERVDANARLKTLYEQGDYEAMLEFHARNRERFTDRAEAGLWVGKAQERLAEDLARKGVRAYQKGSYRQAVSYLERCLQHAPNMSGCHRNLAIAFTRMEEFDRAAMHYERFIELEPDHPEVGSIQKILRDYRSGPDGNEPTSSDSERRRP
jgi:ABC transport system ATP-binding/permease protein